MAIIDKPSDYFNTKLTTGTGNSQAVTGLGFQPDWIWGKRRDSTGNNSLFDSVRGITKGLESNSTGAEFTSSDYYTAFGSDGFTIAAGSGGAGNGNGQTAVQWCWKAGTSFTNDASATGIGTIDSAGSANTTSGFSIVSYTGTGSAGTIKHGLSTAPKMIIQKNRDETQPWWTYVESIGAGGQLRLNATNAAGSDGATLWNSTAPTSSVFSVGDNTGTNGSADKCIAYCFAEKQGYSKFGSYVGNGSTDGTFVYTGFSPAFVMVKRTNGANSWNIKDNRRNNASTSFNINPRNATLLPNDSAADQDANALDFLSNGFKNRSTGNDANNASGTYIYMAFAENPFVASNFVPTTAR